MKNLKKITLDHNKIHTIQPFAFKVSLETDYTPAHFTYPDPAPALAPDPVLAPAPALARVPVLAPAPAPALPGYHQYRGDLSPVESHPDHSRLCLRWDEECVTDLPGI